MLDDREIEILRRYVEKRLPPGEFFESVLKCDMKRMLLYESNRELLYEKIFGIWDWVWKNAPLNSYGSEELVDKWLEGEKLGNKKGTKDE